MEVDPRLNLAEIRLQNLRRQKTLLDLAAEAIVENMRFHSERDTQKRQLKNLPKVLGQKLLSGMNELKCSKPEGDLEKFDVITSTFSLLLSPQIEKIELIGMMTFCPTHLKNEQLDKILKLIATHAPNVEDLVIKKEKLNADCVCFICNSADWLGAESCEAIGSLAKLKMLRLIGWSIKYLDLKKICKSCQSLKYFCGEIIPIDCPDFGDIADFKMAFSHLKIFIFSMLRPENENFTRLCFQHLPNLEVIENFIDCINRKNEEFPLDVEISWKFSALRHLCTVPCAKSLQLLFPEVTHLQVNFIDDERYDEREINALMQFPKLICLRLEDVPSRELVDRFLKTYGHNLKTLVIDFNEEPQQRLEFKSIFNLCPLLQRLVLRGASVTDDKEEIKNFAQLKVLKWTCNDAEERSFSLVNILSAPKLEQVQLDGAYTFEDLEKVSSLIKNNDILRELKYLEFGSICVCLHEIEHLKAVINLIKNASAFLPKLADVRFLLFYLHDPNSNQLLQDEEAIKRLDDPNLNKLLAAYSHHNKRTI